MKKYNLQIFANGVGTVSNSYRMNVKNLVYAMLTSDSSTETVYGSVKNFADARQIQITPTVAKGECYGDGVKKKSDSKVTGYEITVDVNKAQVDVRADWFGHKLTSNGELIVNKDDKPGKFAFGYEIEQSEGHRELVWLFKCDAQPYAYTVQQTEGDIKYASDSIKLTAVCRESDGNFQLIGDTNNSTFTDTLANSFLSTVPTSVTAATE